MDDTGAAMAKVRNIFGRRGGRGMRPWLLLPKVLAIAVYFGGQVVVALLWLRGHWDQMDVTDPARRVLIEHLSIIFRSLLAPTLEVVALLGLGLLIMHGRALLKQRWLRAKLVILLFTVPPAHFYMSYQLGQLRIATIDQLQNHPANWRFTAGLVVVLGVSTLLIILGRLKPRLTRRRNC